MTKLDDQSPKEEERFTITVPSKYLRWLEGIKALPRWLIESLLLFSIVFLNIILLISVVALTLVSVVWGCTNIKSASLAFSAGVAFFLLALFLCPWLVESLKARLGIAT